jgi:hypothetical protein
MGGDYGGYWSEEAFHTNFIGATKETDLIEARIRHTIVKLFLRKPGYI